MTLLPDTIPLFDAIRRETRVGCSISLTQDEKGLVTIMVEWRSLGARRFVRADIGTDTMAGWKRADIAAHLGHLIRTDIEMHAKESRR